MTETKMQLVDWLDDLCVRFIVNLPKEELESVERICFQVEEAQWFYEDFVRPLDPNLPSLNLRQFCLRIFQHCPLLSGFSPYHHSTAFQEFLAYKTRVPVRGAIMLNEAMDEVVLVKGWKKNANWSFPRGKINKDEKDLDCAVREVYEETGFDIKSAKLISDEENAKFIEVTMREQHMRLYVFRGVPMDTHFEPRTRKEISDIQWYKLSELPTLKKMKQQRQEGQTENLGLNANKFYMVAPFLVPLKKWISQQKKLHTGHDVNLHGIIKSQAASGVLVQPDATQNELSIEQPIDDMSRLMNQLRESGQAPTVSDLPELSNHDEYMADVPLRFGGIQAPIDNLAEERTAETLAKSREEKANAMLSLLRSGTKSTTTQPTQLFHPPQTPFEQIYGPPQMPPSPKHQLHHRTTPVSNYPPPSFPLSQSQAVKTTAGPLRQPMPPQIPSQGHYPTPQQEPRFPILSSTHLQPSAKLSLPPTVAPYQRTSNTQSAAGAQFSDHILSSIPPANKLPPPNLTSHSSKLLDIFKSPAKSKDTRDLKSATIPQAAADGISQGDSTSSASLPSDLVQLLKAESESKQTSSMQEPGKVHSMISVERTTVPTPRSNQQETLLNLFRTPSASAPPPSQITTLPLAPTQPELVELSALPTPSHSRVTSAVDKDMSDQSKEPTLNGHMTIKKRPIVSKESSRVGVSATVSGPLNESQFEQVRGKAKQVRGRTANRNVEDQAVTKQHAQPFTILSRPSAPNDQSQSEKNSLPKNFDQVAARKSPPLPKINTEQSAGKIFQPQILRRPMETKIQPQELPSVQQIPLPVTKDKVMLDRQASQSSEQRNTLLSLFSRQGSISSGGKPSFNTSVSPILDKPTRIDDVLPSPLDLSRSRVGSLHPVGGDGNAALSNARRVFKASKASPIDKKFLLGFLDGVVREGNK